MIRPSTSTCPAVGVSKPAMRFNRVDLPQPLAPTKVTISFSCTTRLTSSSAVTTESPASNRLVTDVRSILPIEGLPLVPGEQNVTEENHKLVAEESQQPDAEHRSDHNVVAVKQVGIVEQVTEPASHRENLRDHDKHPGDTHRLPDTVENGRQRRGKDDARKQLALVSSHHPCGLVERDIDLADTMGGVDGRREERTKTDQENRRRVSDTEENQRQRHPGS